MQNYRALRPKASIEACGALLASLARCLANPSQMSLEVAIDIILTLQVATLPLVALHPPHPSKRYMSAHYRGFLGFQQHRLSDIRSALHAGCEVHVEFM